MKIQVKMIVAIFAMIFSVNVSFAQKDVPATPTDDTYQTAPRVPLDVYMEGRMRIVKYLLRKVAWVHVQFKGDSVSSDNSNDKWLPIEELRRNGYVDEGSWTELSQAIYNTPFTGKVVPNAWGYYDVRVEVQYLNLDDNGQPGQTLFEANGYLNVRKEGGQLVNDGVFYSYMGLNPKILAEVPALVNGASLIGSLMVEENLEIFHPDNVNSLIKLNSGDAGSDKNLKISYYDERGNLNLVSINLKSGKIERGLDVLLALLGFVNSSEVRGLVNPTSIDGGDTIFWQQDGSIYGRFPLMDIVIEKGYSFDNSIDFVVQVRNAGKELGIPPSRIIVTSLRDGKSTELPVRKGGGWYLHLEPGAYQLEIRFDKIKDPEENPNPGIA